MLAKSVIVSGGGGGNCVGGDGVIIYDYRREWPEHKILYNGGALSAKQLIATDVAAVALGISRGAVRQLGVRGVLTRHGTRRQQMWDLAEVIQRALKKKRESFQNDLTADSESVTLGGG